MRLHIFGASGSGVTTLGKVLAEKLNVPYFDSDEYFWLKTEPPFMYERDSKDRNNLIISDLSKIESWILGGSIINWGDNLFPEFDLVVFLYLQKGIRIERLKKREHERYGDIIYTDPKRRRQFEDFISWAEDYDENMGIANRTLKAHKDWLAGLSSPFIEINGDFSVSERLIKILDRLHQAKLLPAGVTHYLPSHMAK